MVWSCGLPFHIGAGIAGQIWAMIGQPHFQCENQLEEEFDRAELSAQGQLVVPAKAGTHTPCRLF